MKRIIVFLVLTSIISCHKHLETQKITSTKINTSAMVKNDIPAQDSIFENEIICDSVYQNKNYKIVLRHFSREKGYDENDKNTVFIFSKKINGKYEELLRDSIESHVGAYEFQDFNGDKIKDILIQNISDIRSNWTYYLYLVDLKNDRLTKVKNFNQIKNPHYLPQNNLIDNEVMSGRNWTSFYQIKKDTVFDFGYVIYNGEDGNGNAVDFDKEYDKTLSKVLKNKNYK
ncbi:XAC2610-related protein [Chryseobacterium indoltheticum]|uniref:XAC2610-related protein n=1 Tax=Chryseobacterium indoltheticum TaxID=254 RepID=UPI0019135F4D|nr:hypothetical protein [Chryseobacterium indoltheticum]QQQ29583.1 hypothetical protein JJL46_06115 [Chryseobacterium indoltheticum]